MSTERRVFNLTAAVPILALNARGEETVAVASMSVPVSRIVSSDDDEFDYRDSNDGSRVGLSENVVDIDDDLGGRPGDSNDVDDSGVRPASQNAIENLERIRNEGGSMAMTVCSICLEEFPVGLEAIRMPMPCSHIYHQDCIKKWLNKCNTCPLCRYEMPS